MSLETLARITDNPTVRLPAVAALSTSDLAEGRRSHTMPRDMTVAEAVRAVSVTQFTYSRWRKEYGGLKGNQVKRLKDLEKENERLRKAVSDLTLEKLILREAASGNF